MRVGLVVAVVLGGCGSAGRAPDANVDGGGANVDGGDAEGGEFVLFTGALDRSGAPRDVLTRGDRIERVADSIALDSIDRARVVDVRGTWILPGFVDSHVHLTYYPVASRLPATGVVAAVDLAAPLASLAEETSELRLVRSGPMITATDGYPTQGWGSDGYGFEVGSAAEAARAVDDLVQAGADVIKVPIVEPSLADDALRAIVERAHERERLVVAHALSNAAALRAARAGVDGLAHTPTEALTEETLEAFRGRFVISTLVAFGGSETTVANLRELATREVRVLYGTDLGNLTTIGISRAELLLLERAGLSSDAILDALGPNAAEIWGLEEFGRLEAGARASFVFVSEDPTSDVTTTTRPARVVVDGRELAVE